jgi:hypothetical protein
MKILDLLNTLYLQFLKGGFKNTDYSRKAGSLAKSKTDTINITTLRSEP